MKKLQEPNYLIGRKACRSQTLIFRRSNVSPCSLPLSQSHLRAVGLPDILYRARGRLPPAVQGGRQVAPGRKLSAELCGPGGLGGAEATSSGQWRRPAGPRPPYASSRPARLERALAAGPAAIRAPAPLPSALLSARASPPRSVRSRPPWKHRLKVSGRRSPLGSGPGTHIKARFLHYLTLRCINGLVPSYASGTPVLRAPSR
jgi:hypothetical protein